MIPWAKHEKCMLTVVEDEEEGRMRVRSYKRGKGGEHTVPYLEFDLLNSVPHFPRKRGFLARSLAEEGFVKGLRALEEMNIEQFRIRYQEFLDFQKRFFDWCGQHPEAAEDFRTGNPKTLAAALGSAVAEMEKSSEAALGSAIAEMGCNLL